MLTLSVLKADARSACGYSGVKGEIADATAESMLAHWHELPTLPEVPCGTEGKLYKQQMKEHRRLKKAWVAAMTEKVKADVAPKFLDNKEVIGIIAAVFLLLLGGPMFIILAVIGAVVAWAVEAELEKKYGPQAIQSLAAQLRSTPGEDP